MAATREAKAAATWVVSGFGLVFGVSVLNPTGASIYLLSPTASTALTTLYHF
jgi:hypothetical protein